MKKLFLFIVMLFGVLSVQSLADAMCGSNGEYNPNDGKCWPVQQSQKKVDLYGAIALDSQPLDATSVRVYSWVNERTLEGAKYGALKGCGVETCKIAAKFKNECAAVAVNEDFIGKKDGDSGVYSDTGKNFSQAEKNALNYCEKESGKTCIIVRSACTG